MLTRRELLKTIASISAAGALEGCIPTIRPPDCRHFAESAALNVIDVHCHIFNATDLQVGDFLTKVVARGQPDSPIGIIGAAVQSIGWHFAPSATEELGWLTRRRLTRELTLKALDPKPSLTALLPDMASDSRSRFNAFYDRFRATQPDAFNRFRGSYIRQVERFHLRRQAIRPLSRARLDMLEARLQAQLRSSERLDDVFQSEKDGTSPPILSFIFAFFRFRTENAWLALRMYGCASTPGVDLICPAMVDYDLWLGSPARDDGRTRSHLEDQLKLSAGIARATEGRVHQYAPFNPLRAACDSSYKQLYTDAIAKYGCIGFKVYPPMGFSPWGNESIFGARKFPCSEKSATGAMLDQALAEFYAFCATNGLPILAHASPSNGPSGDAELLGSPEHWEKAFAQYGSSFDMSGSGIRVDFGHFGGDHDVADPATDWTLEFAGLVRSYPFAYADLSYFARILKGQGGRQAVANVLKPLLSQPAISRGVMYGSDWIMLGLESGSQDYLSEFNRFIRGELGLSATICDAILGQNAKRFLGLTVGAKNRTRLEQFHLARGQQAVF